MKINAPGYFVLGSWSATCLLLLVPTAAINYLAQGVPSAMHAVSEASQGDSLLAELEPLLGHNHCRALAARMGRLEESLRQTYAALPKNTFGATAAPTARYALHRLFVQKHGWQLKGLDPSGAKWAEGSPLEALGSRVSPEVQEVFARRLSTQGFNLNVLALVAAMLEHSVHGEAENILRSIYKILRLPLDKGLEKRTASELIDMYMAHYILGVNTSVMTLGSIHEFSKTIHEQHPSWPETKTFLRQVLENIHPGNMTFTFADVLVVVEDAADRFGQWQSKECLALKGQLVELEDTKGPGRVRLPDFYRDALTGGKWQFSETKEYLQQLGAIDETDPSAPRVIIPNYIYSPTNCLASSSFYSVCCIDECEGLMQHLERKLSRPMAKPDEILTLMRDLPLGFAPGNWTPEAGLVKRLREVADHHGESVPLHGRLFAQWLHYAFPRECPFPHVSGTMKPQRPADWEAEAGREATATQHEMARHIGAVHGRHHPTATEPTDGCGGECSAMWTMEEELVEKHVHELSEGAASTNAKRMKLRGFASLAAVGSLLVGFARVISLASTFYGQRHKKYTD